MIGMKKLLIGLIIFWFFGTLELNAKDIVLNCEGWNNNFPIDIQLDLENKIAYETNSEGTYESQILSIDENSISLHGCVFEDQTQKELCLPYKISTRSNDVEWSLYHKDKFIDQGKMNCEFNKDELIASIKDSIQKSLLASINLKKSLCAKIGFEDNSESMANCVFQLMMDENEKKLLDEKNTTIAEANKKKEEELKRQTMIIEQEIIRQKKAAQGAAIDQFLINLGIIFGGTHNSSRGSGQTCFKQGEYTQGMNKVCQYSCTGSGYAITIGATQICPLSVRK